MIIQYLACMKEIHCVPCSCICLFMSRSRFSLVRNTSIVFLFKQSCIDELAVTGRGYQDIT